MTGLRLHVDTAGSTTVQDLGRSGHARLGVPQAGPMDWVAHRHAISLLGWTGDTPGPAVLEIGPGGFVATLRGGAAVLAITGRRPRLTVDGTEVRGPTVVRVSAGAQLAVDAGHGVWATLAIGGGLDVEHPLGSVARHARSGLGAVVTPGTTLDVRPLEAEVRTGLVPDLPRATGPVRVLPAPQTHSFDEESRRALVTEPYATTTRFDRMGAILDGPALHAPEGHDIVSDGIVVGAIQVPGDGRPVLLTADHQTTGGYPKIAVVAHVDLPRLVQLPPGRTVRFAWTSVDEARAARAQVLGAIRASVDGDRRADPVTLATASVAGAVVEVDD